MKFHTFAFDLFFIVLFSPWLLFCAFLALLGTLTRTKSESLETKLVVDAQTVCKVLNNKNLLSDKDYYFETNEVAKMYNRSTFDGYLFIMAPVIFVLRYTPLLDPLVVRLVRRWINVHKFNLSRSNPISSFDQILVKVCTKIAYYMGSFLLVIKIKPKRDVKSLIK